MTQEKCANCNATIFFSERKNWNHISENPYLPIILKIGNNGCKNPVPKQTEAEK